MFVPVVKDCLGPACAWASAPCCLLCRVLGQILGGAAHNYLRDLGPEEKPDLLWQGH